jgi:hypothetical protein
MEYKQKYIKYKLKYMQLKELHNGGNIKDLITQFNKKTYKQEFSKKKREFCEEQGEYICTNQILLKSGLCKDKETRHCNCIGFEKINDEYDEITLKNIIEKYKNKKYQDNDIYINNIKENLLKCLHCGHTKGQHYQKSTDKSFTSIKLEEYKYDPCIENFNPFMCS